MEVGTFSAVQTLHICYVYIYIYKYIYIYIYRERYIVYISQHPEEEEDSLLSHGVGWLIWEFFLGCAACTHATAASTFSL